MHMKVRYTELHDESTGQPYELHVNNGLETSEEGGVRDISTEVIHHVMEGNDKLDLVMMWIATMSDEVYDALVKEVDSAWRHRYDHISNESRYIESGTMRED